MWWTFSSFIFPVISFDTRFISPNCALWIDFRCCSWCQTSSVKVDPKKKKWRGRTQHLPPAPPKQFQINTIMSCTHGHKGFKTTCSACKRDKGWAALRENQYRLQIMTHRHIAGDLLWTEASSEWCTREKELSSRHIYRENILGFFLWPLICKSHFGEVY